MYNSAISDMLLFLLSAKISHLFINGFHFIYQVFICVHVLCIHNMIDKSKCCKYNDHTLQVAFYVSYTTIFFCKNSFADEGNLRLLNAAISNSEVLVTAGLLLFMTIGLLEEPAIYCPMI